MPRKSLVYTVLSALLIVTGTLVAIKFAQGYRPDLKNGTIQGTGLLVANSFPDGAQVFINGKLTTATDDTLNLPPGTYQIEIKRDGFTSWEKTLTLKKELVTQTNATLFASVPNLKPLTFTGAAQPTPSPDGRKLAYLVQAATNSSKNGLWVIDLTDGSLIRGSEPRQILRIENVGDAQASLTWSPNSQQILLSTADANYLLDSNNFNDGSNLRDASARLPVIFSEWEAGLYRKELEKLTLLPKTLQNLLLDNAANIYFSPDEEKVLYTATKAFSIPENLLPDLPSENTQPESRSLTPQTTYIYDLKEDKNFKISDPPPAELGQTPTEKIKLINQIPKLTNLATAGAAPITHNKLQTTADFNAQYSPLAVSNHQWFPTSTHLVSTTTDSVTIIEYDGLNQAAIYSNSFKDQFVYPWPDGSRLIILTNLSANSDLPANLYSINLK